MIFCAAQTILVIAAHPDDETLGVGGTIARLSSAGKEVDIAIVTDGSSAQFGDDKQARERRDRHFQSACDVMGVRHAHRLSFPDMRLDRVAHIEVNEALAGLIADHGYDTIFVHHHGDVNMDHRKIFDSALVATRPMPGCCVRRVLTYYVDSSSEWGAAAAHRFFVPHAWVDITDTIKTKLRALSCYEDELRASPHPRSLEMVEARARSTGATVGVSFAEAFAVVRSVH